MGKGTDCSHEIGKPEVRDNLEELRVVWILVGYNWDASNYVTKSKEVRSFHTRLSRPQFKFLNHKRIKIYTTWLHIDTQTYLADLTVVGICTNRNCRLNFATKQYNSY
jgi:hypothetical protein